MKIKTLLVLSVLVPFMVCCGTKEEIPELPAPTTTVSSDLEDEGDGEEVEVSEAKYAPSSGSGWRVYKIHKGVYYYTFSGKDAITKKNQQVFAIDVDLSSKYTVKLTYTSPSLYTSAAHQMYNSVATMNAGYEAGSIFIRTDGSRKSNLPNTTIGTSGVANWKSEAGFFRDADGTISIRKAATLSRPYQVPANLNSAISALRNYYNNASEASIVSSAPMLIDNYVTVGETFVDESISNWNNLNGENPHKHQRARHPRSAIGLTADNHFIMLVVDGRNDHSAGMNAKELTKFIKKWFNPQYALNMDGGGSSTLCVEGKGDSNTHVVNYPCDNDQYDHAGERKRLTHFIVVPKNQ